MAQGHEVWTVKPTGCEFEPAGCRQELNGVFCFVTNAEMKIFNFSRARIEPTTCRVYTLVPLCLSYL